MKYILFLSLAMIFLGCPKDEPCTTCPPPVTGDTLRTFERVLADGEQPAVSPDGKKIAYTYNGDIFVMDTSVQTTMWWDGQNWRYDTTGGKITQLTNGSAIDILPRWSPDGQTVGFVRLQTELDDNGRIFTVSSGGGNLKEIQTTHFFSNKLKRRNESGSAIGVPMWEFSPDEKYIAFLSQENDSDYLNVVDYPSGLQRFRKALFKYLNDDAPCFAWSLNSGEIAFIAGERDTANQKRMRAQLFDFLDNIVKKDSLVSDGDFITRFPNQNRFAYRAYDPATLAGITFFTDFSTTMTKHPATLGEAPKLSPDERLFIYQRRESVPGPFGYNYSTIVIYNIETYKKYSLTKEGDVNRANYYFEWGKSSNVVFFERYKKIVNSTFILPQ